LPPEPTMQSSSSSSSSSGRIDCNAATDSGAEDDDRSEAEPPSMRARTLRSPDANATAVDARRIQRAESAPASPRPPQPNSGRSPQVVAAGVVSRQIQRDESAPASPRPPQPNSGRSPQLVAAGVVSRQIQRDESAPASPRPNSGRSSEALASGVFARRLQRDQGAAVPWNIGRVPKLPRHESLTLRWDVECPYCGCQHLNTSTVSFRNKCCLGGTIDSKWTPLQPLIGSLDTLLQTKDGIQHMSSSSTSYNNILSVGELLPVLLYFTKTSCLFSIYSRMTLHILPILSSAKHFEYFT
jgi:hypothetical protein